MWIYFFILEERQTHRYQVKVCMAFLANSLISIFSVHLPLAGFPVGGPWTLLRHLWTSTLLYSTLVLWEIYHTSGQLMPCFAQSFYATVFVLYPHLSGLIHPYWSRINSEKTCPLMVFWNLSVWAFNGAENWIVPKDCWAKKMSVGGLFFAGRPLVLYWQIIETASTAPFTRLTLSSLDNGLARISVAPNFIGPRFVTSDIWPFEKRSTTTKFVLFMLHEKDSLCMLAPCQGSLSEH